VPPAPNHTLPQRSPAPPCEPHNPLTCRHHLDLEAARAAGATDTGIVTPTYAAIRSRRGPHDRRLNMGFAKPVPLEAPVLAIVAAHPDRSDIAVGTFHDLRQSSPLSGGTGGAP
jgi:hypothetical protein